MGKRSHGHFVRRKNDRYLTPFDPVSDLKPHLPGRFRFAEPCAANGQLVDYLRAIGGSCLEALDINPGRCDVMHGDALRWTPRMRVLRPLDYIISNPPWTREILHRMIRWFSWIAPTWLLFDADWVHTKQAAPYLPWCRKIVSVGRVKWMAGSKNTGKDNAAWHFFDRHQPGPTEFIGRAA